MTCMHCIARHIINSTFSGGCFDYVSLAQGTRSEECSILQTHLEHVRSQEQEQNGNHTEGQQLQHGPKSLSFFGTPYHAKSCFRSVLGTLVGPQSYLRTNWQA